MPKRTLQDINLNDFSEKLHSESDRACAVLGAALLDARLESVFRCRLRAYQDELLGKGALSSFSVRIQLASALSWISDDARFDLETIRTIRNDFAHSFNHTLAFGDQSISDRCSNLRTAQAYINGFDIAAERPQRNLSAAVIYSMQSVFKPPRWRYLLAVEFLAQYLEEIPTDSTESAGADLLQEVRSLSANTRGQVTAQAMVNPASTALSGEPVD
jgi:DNA-binding MltR family transcriptional regulator